MYLHVTDPTGAAGVTHVTVPGRYTTTDVRVTAGDLRSTTLEIPRAAGRTLDITLRPYIPGTRHRASAAGAAPSVPASVSALPARDMRYTRHH
jgi:hypothetical protein